MTTRERVMAALAGREVNRVPLAVWMHNFASENSAHGLAAETPTNSGPGSESGISLHAIETHHDSELFLLPRCYPKPSRTTPIHPIRPQSQAKRSAGPRGSRDLN